MNIDFKELGIQLAIVLLALVVYNHVIAPMMSGGMMSSTPAPAPAPTEGE